MTLPGYVPQVSDFVKQYAGVTPDKVAQIDLASGRRETYGQMHERVAGIAGHLRALGVAEGDRVGFLSLNTTDIPDIILATWRIGGISLALNFRLTATELAYILNDAEPDVVFIGEEFAALIPELQTVTSVRHWIRFDGLGGAESELEKAITSADPIYDRVPQTMNDQCLLMYSSGTTGHPKGVIITYGMIFYSAYHGVAPFKNSTDTVSLAVMPLFHIGGLNVTSLPILILGGTSVVMRAFDPGLALDVINDPDIGVTHMLAVPAMYTAMKAHPKNADTDFSRLISAAAGGESVPVPLVKWWYDRGVTILDGYGMTESAASNCIASHSDVPDRVGSSGKALMFTEMRIVRADGTDAEPNEPGEIWMRGPVITPGYWRNEEANAAAFSDGWFKSGDIARRDAEGYFYIEDRTKDMYISGGENVYPAEVESTLYGLDSVAEVAVIGVGDDQWGEVGCAVIVPADGCTVTLDDLQAYSEGKLARYKHPKHCVIMDELPRNATGKVQKFKLRDMVPELLGLSE
ncbi:acid--CoA ligase [Kordiimonas sediminis]|uniref:3-methylmercaptopropionyl-CoA ligase n=1 Tax=Kordiimonas sediminis TaxID=1735581 RepID=A0A919ALG8_9PROT|nr:long-chain fatty acid--CoA ligase [Kordiimonas sediminis]GHF14104.1 acid--CoA ligase [Kordiimonas sediminis]